MAKSIHDIPTPAVLIDSTTLDRNILAMQSACDKSRVELWPHIKTHKLVPVLQRQLAAGAKGITCAKVSEAEALLPSGVRRVFIAHSLSEKNDFSRISALAREMDEVILAVTSMRYFDVLSRMLASSGLRVPVLMAVNTGLHREGVRTPADAAELALRIRECPHMEFRGIYTHEGHAYSTVKDEATLDEVISDVLQQLRAYGAAIGGDVPFWPGCSVTAAKIAERGGVHAVRPGAYVFGDLFLSQVTSVMKKEQAAATVLTTVVDIPTPDLALIDAGSKVFSSDKIPDGVFAQGWGRPDLNVTRLSEEHGFIANADRLKLRIGERVQCIPAHICTVMNLTSRAYLIDGEKVLETWKIDARGCVH